MSIFDLNEEEGREIFGVTPLVASMTAQALSLQRDEQIKNQKHIILAIENRKFKKEFAMNSFKLNKKSDKPIENRKSKIENNKS